MYTGEILQAFVAAGDALVRNSNIEGFSDVCLLQDIYPLIFPLSRRFNVACTRAMTRPMSFTAGSYFDSCHTSPLEFPLCDWQGFPAGR
jgi:hypothetical protein